MDPDTAARRLQAHPARIVTALHLLVVEDSEDDALLLAAEVESAGYDLSWRRVQAAAQLRAALAEAEWDVVISDDNLPGFSSTGALGILHEVGRDLPFIIVSGAISEERAVAAMKAGAHDYVMKGNRLRLLPAIERELADAESRRARRAAEAALKLAAEEHLSQLERRVAERTAELERAQHAKEELLATVSHELRTPLASMLGAVELLQNPAIAEAQRRQLMEVTLGEGQRLRSLIENFLSLQRMEHGWHAVAPRPTDTRALLAHAAAEASKASETGAESRHLIVVDAAEDLPHVLADLEPVQLVLTNLLSNARKYSPSGSTIRVHAHSVTTPNRTPAIEISIHDEGI